METQWGWVGGRRTKGTIRPHCTEAVARAFECRRTQRGLASTCNHTTIFNRSVLSEDIPPRFFSCAFHPQLSLKTVSIYVPWHLCQESVFDSLLTKIHKVHTFWEGNKILRHLHLTFDYSKYSQKLCEDFAKFCGLLRIYEL